MVTGFLIIVGIYGMCAALIHLFHARKGGKKSSPVYHLVLVTRNNQSQIEWYVYAYLFVSWLRGRETVVAVFDDGSTDETKTILRRLADREWSVRLYDGTDGLERYVEEHRGERIMVLRLSMPEMSPKSPLLQW